MANNIKSIQRQLKGIRDDLMDEVDDAVKDGLDETKTRAKTHLARQDAIHTGAVYRGFWQSATATSNGRRRTLTNRAQHAKFVERGTGDKGFYDAPSLSTQLIRNIEFWVDTKPSVVVGDRDSSEVAYWIAHSISASGKGPSGTAPQPFMGPAWQRGKRAVKRNARVAVKEVLR